MWNHSDLDLADRLFSSTYVNHGGLIPDLVCGPEAIKVSVAMYHRAFPGLAISIDRLEAEGDMVELGWAAHTSLRPLARRAAAGGTRRPLVGTTRARLAHGQIAESWMTWAAKRSPFEFVG